MIEHVRNVAILDAKAYVRGGCERRLLDHAQYAFAVYEAERLDGLSRNTRALAWEEYRKSFYHEVTYGKEGH